MSEQDSCPLMIRPLKMAVNDWCQWGLYFWACEHIHMLPPWCDTNHILFVSLYMLTASNSHNRDITNLAVTKLWPPQEPICIIGHRWACCHCLCLYDWQKVDCVCATYICNWNSQILVVCSKSRINLSTYWLSRTFTNLLLY